MTIDYPQVLRLLATGLMLSWGLSSGTADAATIAVAGDCTLGHAIANANADADTDGARGCVAGSGADTLEVAPNSLITLRRVDNVSISENGLPFVVSVIRINGYGSTVARSTAPGVPGFRLLHVGRTGALTVFDLKFTGGEQPGRITYGGAIVNEGTLRLVRCEIVANSATFGGGLATIAGATTLIDSLVANNHAAHFVTHSVGGGILSDGGSTTLIRTTVVGNEAEFGGGITNQEGGDLTVTDSTLSGNKATENGGGIMNFFGTVMLNGSTLSGNRTLGAGHPINPEGTATLFNHTGTLSVAHSIVANSRGGSDCGGGEGGVTRLRGVNLVEDGSCGGPVTADPRLGPLLDNGGNTPTHALMSGSVALNSVEADACLKTDQRGLRRPEPAGGRCDVGAFERISGVPGGMRDLIAFFDAQVGVANLVGVGAGPLATQRRAAFRQQLLTAGRYAEQGFARWACLQLNRSLRRIMLPEMGDQDAYVGGAAVTDLAARIRQVRTAWQC